MATDPHPVTEQAAAARWNADARLIPWDDWGPVGRAAILDAFRDMHDAGREHERANPVDDRPWEPLNEGDPLNVGDEVRRDFGGVTTIAVVVRVDDDGDPWATERLLIGLLCHGTWYVRRAAPELPTEEDGVVLIPADGCEYITATVGGQKYRAREAIQLAPDHWHAAWRSDEGVLPYVIAERIDAGTWKVDDQ